MPTKELPDELAIIQYDVVDGPIRETHRWVASASTPLGDVLEWIGNTPTIDPGSLRIYHASWWLDE